MKFLFVILTSVVFTMSIYAQTEIKGCVLDSKERKPIATATVTLHHMSSQDILGYAITNDEGFFVLKQNTMPDSVTVSVRAMTIETQSKHVRSDVGFIEFLVKEKITELKEVIVKAPKVRQLGDTINYNVAAFTDATDRSIGDVLKKLPGIQVLSSGQILYQNKAISKFYIEGLDMLQGKYGIATNNVDASKVATVQVLENHQPVKLLKDMEIPEAAAINLRLRDSAKGAFFATAQAGVGLPGVLLSNELVGMRFTRNQQNMLVYKGDNTGRDVARELTSFYDEAKNMGMNFLSVQMPSPPAIKEQHYLFNDAHTVSLNDLRVLKKDLTLTGNLSFLHDKQKSDSYAKQDIFLTGNDNIRIEESANAHLLKRELEGTLTLEGNTNNYFVNNTLRVQSKWNNLSSEILFNITDLTSQFLKLPEWHISNDFEYLLKKGDTHYRMGVFAGYTTQNHFLRVSPSLFAPLFGEAPEEENSPLQQNVSYNHLASKAFLSGGLKKKISMWYTAAVFSNHYNLQSDMLAGTVPYRLTPDSLSNNFSRNEFGVQASSTFMVEFSPKFKPQLAFPITYLWVARNDKSRQTDANKGYLIFSPLLIIQYSITPRIILFSNISFSNNIDGIGEDYLGYIMTSYRNMNRNDGMQSKSNRTGAFAHLSYKNPFTTLFASLRFFYDNTWSNTLRDIRYNGILSSVIGIYYPNSADSYGAGLSFGQSIDAIRSEVKLDGGYNERQGKALNQGIISNTRYRSFNISPSITTDIGKFMIVKYNVDYRQEHSTIAKKKMLPIHSFTQHVSTSFIPVKKLVFSLSFNHYYNSLLESSARSLWFGDAGLKCKFKNADVMLDWSNIFDTRRFVNSLYSDVSSYYSVYELRPSEVLLRIRFKIL
ncbi:MAG: hypothetical protein Q4G63_07345 [Bacteroidia bacterium]|nr:hypothetical protein [Bacteroidia bacterium]